MGDHSVDERAYNAFKQSLEPLMKEPEVSTATELRHLIREQHALLLDRPREALGALPRLLPTAEDRARALEVIEEIATARGALDPRRAARLAEIQVLLEDDERELAREG